VQREKGNERRVAKSSQINVWIDRTTEIPERHGGVIKMQQKPSISREGVTSHDTQSKQSLIESSGQSNLKTDSNVWVHKSSIICSQ